jgi:hypothetical protein
MNCAILLLFRRRFKQLSNAFLYFAPRQANAAAVVHEGLLGIVSQTMAIAARLWRAGRLVADQDIVLRHECICQAAIDASSHPALEEFAEECCRLIRNADDLVGCLAIEFEIELGRGVAVIPVSEKFEFAPPQ